MCVFIIVQHIRDVLKQRSGSSIQQMKKEANFWRIIVVLLLGAFQHQSEHPGDPLCQHQSFGLP